MQIQIDAAWLLTVLLASLRMAALLMFTPVLGGMNTPPQARLLLLLALTAAMLAALPAHAAPPALLSMPALGLAGARELLIGGAMAFGLYCAFGSLAFAGKLLDMQIGYSVGSIFDPVTRSSSPLLGTLLTTLGTVVFYTMDGHHMLVRMVAYSFSKVPPGGDLPWQSLSPFVDQFGAMFVLGLTLAAPVVVALFLVDLGLGIVSRTMPQMNVFLVAIVVKIIVGLLILTVALGAMAPVVTRIFNTSFAYWQRLFE